MSKLRRRVTIHIEFPQLKQEAVAVATTVIDAVADGIVATMRGEDFYKRLKGRGGLLLRIRELPTKEDSDE